MSSEGTRAAALCCACNKLTGSESSVKLWDGRSYCRTCLDNACPELAEYAERHESLEESMPEQFVRDDVKRFLVRLVILFLAVSGAVLVLIVLAAAGGAFLESFSRGIAVFLLGEVAILCVFLPIIAISAYVSWREGRYLLPNTRASAGRLHVRFGKRNEDVALSGCRWSVGRLCGMRLYGMLRYSRYRAYVMLSRAPAILIRLPGGSIFTHGPIIVAVGYTAEMRELWCAFLTLAGVPSA